METGGVNSKCILSSDEFLLVKEMVKIMNARLASDKR